MEDTQKRLYASEREAILRLELAMQFLGIGKRDLAGRLEMVERGKCDAGMLQNRLQALLLRIYRTVPTNQLENLKHSLHSMQYVIGVGPGGRQHNAEYGFWLSFDQINTILAALKDHCLMCNLDLEGQRKCKLAGALDDMGNDLHDLPGGGCKYRGVI